MQARDIMTASVATVRPDTEVSEIAKRLLARNISAVPVIDDQERVIGIVSEGDLMRRPESGTERQPSWWLDLFADAKERTHDYVKSHGLHARDVMSREVISVGEHASLAEVATMLEKHQIKRVPVLHDGKLVGIVSRANLLQGLAAAGTLRVISPSDREIKMSIEMAAHDAGLPMHYINVTVVDGIVAIWGMVESEAEKALMRSAAEGIAGVREVHDNANIRSNVLHAALGI
jgi:CBS domain-containing protein